MKVLLGLFLLASSIFAAPSAGSTEKEVWAAMNAYKNAYLHADGAAMNKLLSNNLVFVHSDGSVQDKAGVIKHIVVGPPPEKIEFLPDTRVRVYGAVAYVTGHEDHWDKRTTIHMHSLHVWEKTPAGWQLVARQATLIDIQTRGK